MPFPVFFLQSFKTPEAVILDPFWVVFMDFPPVPSPASVIMPLVKYSGYGWQ